MNTEKEVFLKRLEAVAYKKSMSFCYTCYVDAPTGWCATCGSDDLMRIVHGVACEYGITWIVEHLIKDSLTPVNVDESFEDSIRECYPETVQVGWLTLDVADTIKNEDPISWDLAKSEWIDSELDAETMISFDNGSTCYWTYEVEKFLDESEAELEAAG